MECFSRGSKIGSRPLLKALAIGFVAVGMLCSPRTGNAETVTSTSSIDTIVTSCTPGAMNAMWLLFEACDKGAPPLLADLEKQIATQKALVDETTKAYKKERDGYETRIVGLFLALYDAGELKNNFFLPGFGGARPDFDKVNEWLFNFLPSFRACWDRLGNPSENSGFDFGTTSSRLNQQLRALLNAKYPVSPMGYPPSHEKYLASLTPEQLKAYQAIEKDFATLFSTSLKVSYLQADFEEQTRKLKELIALREKIKAGKCGEEPSPEEEPSEVSPAAIEPAATLDARISIVPGR